MKKRIRKEGVTDKHSDGKQTPRRTAPRLEGVVKNTGIKEKKKPKKEV